MLKFFTKENRKKKEAKAKFAIYFPQDFLLVLVVDIATTAALVVVVVVFVLLLPRLSI